MEKGLGLRNVIKSNKHYLGFGCGNFCWKRIEWLGNHEGGHRLVWLPIEGHVLAKNGEKVSVLGDTFTYLFPSPMARICVVLRVQ